MTGAPIELNFYSPETDEIEQTFRRSMIPFGILKEAMKLQSMIENSGDQYEQFFDAIGTFVIRFFGDKFGMSDLEQKADTGDVFAVFANVVARAGQMAGAENFRPGATERPKPPKT